MSGFPIDVNDASKPADGDEVQYIAAEMRAVKGKLNTKSTDLATLTSQVSTNTAAIALRATIAYVNSLVIAAGNVVAPSNPTDDGKVLTAGGGVWSWVTLPLSALMTSLTGSVKLAAGTTAQRDAAPQFGWLRANSTLSALEWFNGTVWGLVSNPNTFIDKFFPVTATASTNTLILTLDPCTVDIRDVAATNGIPNTRSINSQLTLTVPDGATLGSQNGIPFELAIILLDITSLSGGVPTFELAVANLAATFLDERKLISTTAMSVGSDANSIVYSATARASIPFRIVGLVTQTQATAGTYVSAMTLVQGIGGQVVAPPPINMVRLSEATSYGSTNTMIRRFVSVVTNIGDAITYSDSATLGASFTINESGLYAISYIDQFSADSWLGISLNSPDLTTAIQSNSAAYRLALTITNAANYPEQAACTLKLSAGDVIRAHAGGAASGVNTTFALFIISKVG